MTHVHGCLNCKPDMVPAFSKDDPRYHDREKCGVGIWVTVDGAVPGYTGGMLEGAEGWALLASRGMQTEQIHECPTCTEWGPDGFLKDGGFYSICVAPIFGKVELIHECPSRLKAQADRLKAALKPLVSDDTYRRAIHGEEA